MKKQSPKRGAISFEDLVAQVAAIDTIDDNLRRGGYQRHSARAYKHRDGAFTIRCVWRQRSVLASAVTCSLQGISLP